MKEGNVCPREVSRALIITGYFHGSGAPALKWDKYLEFNILSPSPWVVPSGSGTFWASSARGGGGGGWMWVNVSRTQKSQLAQGCGSRSGSFCLISQNTKNPTPMWTEILCSLSGSGILGFSCCSSQREKEFLPGWAPRATSSCPITWHLGGEASPHLAANVICMTNYKRYQLTTFLFKSEAQKLPDVYSTNTFIIKSNFKKTLWNKDSMEAFIADNGEIFGEPILTISQISIFCLNNKLQTAGQPQYSCGLLALQSQYCTFESREESIQALHSIASKSSSLLRSGASSAPGDPSHCLATKQ